MARKEPAELSEFEKQRLANKVQRDNLVKQLALDAASAGLAPQSVKTQSKSSSSQKKKPAVKKLKVEVAPRRTSSRLAGLEADGELAKRKADDEYAAVQEVERAKRQRVSGDLNLSDVVVAGKEWDQKHNFFVDVVSRSGKPYERTFGEPEVKKTTDKELRALREKMSGLELYDGFEPNRIKITPERVYALGFHPTVDKALIFAGDKLGNLGIFDASQTASYVKSEPIKAEAQDDEVKSSKRGRNLPWAASRVKSKPKIKSEEQDEYDLDDNSDPNITSFHLHSRTISSFQFSSLNPSHLYTSSYDSSIRLLDLSKSTSTEVYAPLDSSLDEALSGVEVDSKSPHVLYFSRLDGCLGRTDTRSPGSPDIFQLSEKKIGGFSLHPGITHFVATASLDRYMRVWDLRKMSGKTGMQMPHPVGEHESRLSVSHAAFNSAGQIATSSYDDTLKIYTFKGMSEWPAGKSLSENEMQPSSIFRHNNQTGRWVTM